MQILRLRAANFRRFKDLDLNFAEGLNLIRGPNESGKSTLVLAVLAGLFARPQTNTILVRSYLRWGSKEAPVIELDFVQEGRKYSLVKDFGARTVVLKEDGEAELRTIKAVNSRINELIGFSDPSRYLRTACVTHDQMVSLAEDTTGARKIAGMLREVVVGSQESALMDAAFKRLSGEVDDLKRGLDRPTNNPGIIKRLLDEREALIARQKELSQGLSELEGQRERLRSVEAQLEADEPRLAELEEVLARNRRVEETELRRREAERRFRAADRAREAARELEHLDEKIQRTYPKFLDLDPAVATDLRKAIDLRKSLERVSEEFRDMPPEEEQEAPRPEPPKRSATAMIVGGIALTLIGILLGLVVHPALFAVTAVGLLIEGAGAFMAYRRPVIEYVGFPKLLDERMRKTDDEIARLRQSEREFLDSVGHKDSAEFLRAYDDYLKLVARRDQAEAALKALLGGRTVEQVDRERRDASLEAAAAEERLKDLRPFRVEPEKLAAAARERDRIAARVEDLHRERDGLSFHLMRTGADPDEAAKVEEELAWLWEAEQSARRRLRVYTIARDAMEEAARSLVSSAVPVLSVSVGKTFSTLTGGRYEEVEVRESDLALSVFSKEKGDYIPGDELLSSLSKGTASQLYLAARLELVDVLSSGRKPPLIFDDSFSYFDDKRLEMLWNVLLEVAREQQVLLLTCTDRYDSLSKSGVHVVDLPGP